MKSRIFPLLALVLVLVTSLSMVGCGGGGEAKFTVSSCTISPNPTDIGSPVTISAVITETAGVSGTYNATLNIGGTNIETKDIAVAAKGRQTVSFTYTPSAEGSFNVSIGKAFGTLGVTKPPTGYWDIKYKVANGSRIFLNYSLQGTTGVQKTVNLSSGAVIIRVNKTAVNGYRDVILPSAGWQLPSIFVDSISSGVDMNLVIALKQDATGKLYVQDGIGDVDMRSVSALTTNPKQTNTYGDGKKDTAGSFLSDTVLEGHAEVGIIGKKVNLPFGLVFTTGTITNTVTLPKSKFNGAFISSQGIAFAKSGTLKTADGKSLPDYVGTAGTITTTGTGDCLGIFLVTFDIDFQAEIKLVLEPESAK